MIRELKKNWAMHTLFLLFTIGLFFTGDAGYLSAMMVCGLSLEIKSLRETLEQKNTCKCDNSNL